MRVLREIQQKTMVWKNGGGQTIEMAIGPEGASLEDFDWRISRARIERPGPFSVFPDIDRTLMLLEGKSLLLSLPGGVNLRLRAPGEVVQLPGDQPVSCEPEGIVQDLNVMTRRGVYRHEVSMLTGRRQLDAGMSPGSVLALYAFGSGRLTRNSTVTQLAAADLALLEPDDLPIEVVPGLDARIVAIEIIRT